MSKKETYFHEVRRILTFRLKQLPHFKNSILPEWTQEDLDTVKDKVIEDIAQKLWWDSGCQPKRDKYNWLLAEEIFFYSLYLWEYIPVDVRARL